MSDNDKDEFLPVLSAEYEAKFVVMTSKGGSVVRQMNKWGYIVKTPTVTNDGQMYIVTSGAVFLTVEEAIDAFLRWRGLT